MPQPMTKGVVSGGKERRKGQRRKGREKVLLPSFLGRAIYRLVKNVGEWEHDRRTTGERRQS